MSKYFKYTICLLLITTIFVMPFSGFTIKKAKADNSIAGYIKGLAPVIAKMPGCQKAIGNGVSDLFSKVKDLFSTKSSSDDSSSTGGVGSLIDAGGNYTGPGSSGGDDDVTVSDQAVLNEQKKSTAELGEIKKSQDDVEKNQNCLNSIGKAIAKVLINKSTDSIINWINTGNAGGPLFVQDPGAYFKSIAEDQTLGFGAEISDPELYPFGKDFMKMQADSFKSKFANNAQYSLNEVIQNSDPNYSAETFGQDFSQGGWDAWNAMTQNPANNPMGFSLMASNELAKRIEDKTSLAQGSLQMGSGFLGVQECADPKGVTKSQDELGREERRENPNLTGPYENPICNSWVDVTPGKFVGEQLVSAVQKKDNALLDVSTLNDAMGAILDSVLAKFTNMLQTSGVASLEKPASSDYYAYDAAATGIGNFQNEKDYSKGEINSSKWLKDHPDFNIRTDLDQALVDELRIYYDKIKTQNDELISRVPSTPEFPLGNAGLIPTIYQLDYCVPGPHPGWEDEARANLQATEDSVPNFDGMNFQKIADVTGYAVKNWGLDVYEAVQALPFIGGSITTPDSLDQYARLIGGGPCATGSGYSTTITDCVIRKQYEPRFRSFTHIQLRLPDEYVNSYGKLTGALDSIFSQYAEDIKHTYIPLVLPSVAKENETLFNKIPGYYKTYNNNKKTMDMINGTIARFIEIKKQVDTLNCQLDPSCDVRALPSGSNTHIDQDAYDKALLPWKLAFARLSTSLYSGNDIAAVDTMTKQMVDERDYVFKNLISTSPTSCEQEMKTLYNKKPQQWLSGGDLLDRPDYPMPHLYDYPNHAGTADDPVKGFLWFGAYVGGHGNKTPAVNMCKAYEVYGESSQGDCENFIGPTFISISGVESDHTNGSGLIGSSIKELPDDGNFERDVLKVY